MKIKPHHFAALQYSIVSAFLIATWYLMLWPLDNALEQLAVIFAADYERRDFFILLAISSVVSVLMVLIYWFPHSASPPFRRILAIASVAIFAAAIWQYDGTMIFAFGIGAACAIWAWYAPNVSIGNKPAAKETDA